MIPYKSAVCTVLLFLLAACEEGKEKAVTFEKEAFLPPSPFAAVHGIAFDSKGQLYAGSVLGQSVFRVDPETGAVERLVGWPEGQADDLEVGPDNNLVWTNIIRGEVYSLDLNDVQARPKLIAKGPMGFNPIAFRADGRLYSALTFYGDALYEIDPKGEKEPRLIVEKMGGFNGFDFGPDDKLYAPVWFKKQVARMDVDSGQIDVIAEGFGTPAAVNFDSKGNLYAVDTHRGEVVRLDIKNGQKEIIAKVDPAIDNLALSPDDRLFISNMADGGIYEINVEDGSVRTVVEGKISVAGDIAYAAATENRPATLYVAGIFAIYAIDAKTGAVEELARAEKDEIGHPTNVSVQNDKIILTSWEGGLLQIYDRASHRGGPLRKGLGQVQGTVMLDDRHILAAEGKSKTLLKIPLDTQAAVETFSSGLEGAGPMVRQGDVVYLSEIEAGKVTQISLLDGTRKVIAQNLQSPEGLALYLDGRLVVAEAGAHRLLFIDPETGEQTVIAENLPIGIPDVPGMAAGWVPTGVAVTSEGEIFLSSDMETAIYRFHAQK
jgi:sugar lactone lactonase YvrE